jgi:ribonuclease Z
MEKFEVYILGCGSALPTLHHYASSQIISIREKMFMVDCGEGTQMQLRRSKIRFTKINNIFISHLHGDHCFGLIGMISTFGMLGRTAPLDIYAPIDFGPILDMLLKSFCDGLEYKVRFHAIDTTSNNIIYEDRSLTVMTIPLRHRIPCCGFLFREKPTLPHIRRDMVDFYNVPIYAYNDIKKGKDWVTSESEIICASRLTSPANPVRSYAYCSDTAYIPDLYELIQGVSALYHESTYGNDDEGRARKYSHSTAAQAAKVAQAAKAGMLILGHYSARYENEEKLLMEAKEIFPNTFLSNENKVFVITK